MGSQYWCQLLYVVVTICTGTVLVTPVPCVHCHGTTTDSHVADGLVLIVLLVGAEGEAVELADSSRGVAVWGGGVGWACVWAGTWGWVVGLGDGHPGIGSHPLDWLIAL